MLLYTDDATQAHQEITRSGGRVLHVLTPSVLVADLPMPTALETCTTVRPEGLDTVCVWVADAWLALWVWAATESIPWDSPGYEPPD